MLAVDVLGAEFQPDNALWLLIGAALGAIAGWSLKAMQYARRTAVKVEEIEDDMKDDKGSIQFDQSFAAGLAVAFAFIGMITGAFAAQQSNEQSDRIDQTVTCLLDSFEDQTRALNQRTTFSDDAAAAEKRYLRAYEALLSKVADPDASVQEQVAALQEAQEATAVRLRLLDKTAEQRQAFPYPDADEVRKCARGKD